MSATKNDMLQGWKDIAVYVSRDVRTVKRWEKQRGLPVRRTPGEGRANVYALIPELDDWLSSGATSGAEPEEEATEASELRAPAPALFLVPAVATDTPAFEPGSRLSRRSTDRAGLTLQQRWVIAAGVVVCVGTIVALTLSVRARHRERVAVATSVASPPLVAQAVKYRSKVAGVDALYLRGIYFYEQRTPDALERAIKCFNEAIAKDPGDAPSYSGLAQAYNLVREYSVMPEAEAYAKAEAAARHAIALDPNLSDAHASLGFVKFFWDWDAAGAESEFKTSIALDPQSALAHHWYGSMLTHQGRFAESLAQLDIAQHLQPTSASIVSDKAFALGISGHRNEAADMLQEVVNEDPQSPAPHYILADISLIEPSDLARYLYEMRRFATLRHDPAELHMLDIIEPAYRLGGGRAMWLAMLAEEERQNPSPNNRTRGMATVEAVLGRRDDCLRDLEQLAKRRDSSMVGLVIDPMMGSVRQDPRFAAILESLGEARPH